MSMERLEQTDRQTENQSLEQNDIGSSADLKQNDLDEKLDDDLEDAEFGDWGSEIKDPTSSESTSGNNEETVDFDSAESDDTLFRVESLGGVEGNSEHSEYQSDFDHAEEFESNEYTSVEYRTESKDDFENFKRFDRDEFPYQNSYDARVSSYERELVGKTSMEPLNMGYDESNVLREPKDSYSQDEIVVLKEAREKIDSPTENTVMQKVIGVDTGNIENDLRWYINPVDSSNNPSDVTVRGFVSKAEDAAPFTTSPEASYEALRLDYRNSIYVDPNQDIYILRYTDGTNYEIPYSPEFGGDKDIEQPFTGTGYIGNDEHVIPEFVVIKDDIHEGAPVTDGVIYKVNASGEEIPVAQFNKDDRCFDPI